MVDANLVIKLLIVLAVVIGAIFLFEWLSGGGADTLKDLGIMALAALGISFLADVIGGIIGILGPIIAAKAAASKKNLKENAEESKTTDELKTKNDDSNNEVDNQTAEAENAQLANQHGENVNMSKVVTGLDPNDDNDEIGRSDGQPPEELGEAQTQSGWSFSDFIGFGKAITQLNTPPDWFTDESSLLGWGANSLPDIYNKYNVISLDAITDSGSSYHLSHMNSDTHTVTDLGNGKVSISRKK